MPSEIFMPQLGLTMTEGTIVKWLKKVGDPVAKGEPIFEVETDKVVQEVVSLEEGTLARILVGDGGVVPVGKTVAYLAAPGESLAEVGGNGNGETPRLGDAETRGSPLPLGEAWTGQSADMPQGVSTGPRGEGSSARGLALGPQSSVLSPEGWVRASPAAKRLAEKLGIDYRSLKGSGPGGRIVEADVRRAAEAKSAAPVAPAVAPQGFAAPAAPAPPRPPVSASPVGERVELKGVRKVVAERMALSFSTAPHFYLTVEVDAGNLVAFHRQVVPVIEKRYGVKPTITDILIKATAVSLREHPEVNASWADGAIRRNGDVNLGVAASMPEGLIVPVIPNADRLGLGEIARKRKDLVERARAGRLTLSDLEGGTFTLSNLGMFGIDQFQAIVNPPQAGILAVGRIKDRVVPVDGQVGVKPTMFLTLSVDHRVLDGADGARFLARIVELLEQPMELVLGE